MGWAWTRSRPEQSVVSHGREGQLGERHGASARRLGLRNVDQSRGERKSGAKTSFGELWAAWEDYREETHHEVMTQKAFALSLDAAGIKNRTSKVDGTSARMRVGILLRNTRNP